MPSKSNKSTPSPVVTAIVDIETIGARGDGVATHDGRKVFTPFTAPGDVAKIEIDAERGKLLALEEKSDWRRDPPCHYCGQCGGCALQHISHHHYANLKRSFVEMAFAQENIPASLLNPTIECAADSRRRALFAVRRKRGKVIIGFHERASRQIVDIEACIIATPSLSAALPRLRKFATDLCEFSDAFNMQVTACDNGIDVNLKGTVDIDDGGAIFAVTEVAREANILRLAVNNETVVEFDAPIVTFGTLPAAIPPGAFLQASKEGETAIRDIITAEFKGMSQIVDLFSGCGTFSLPLGERAGVVAFDSEKRAIDTLNTNARHHSFAHPVEGRKRNLFNKPLMKPELDQFDAVIIDPPRAGARAQSLELAKSAVSKIVSVSCNPTTFARDAAILRDGGFALRDVTPVDQFVWSPHVELVGVFDRQ